MDDNDSKRVDHERLKSHDNSNNNNRSVLHSFWTQMSRPFRRCLNFFYIIFRNCCTDRPDGRSFGLWIRRLFRRNRNLPSSSRLSLDTYLTTIIPQIDKKHEYSMDHEKRGLAVIFNQEHFAPHIGLSQRIGTSVDLDSLIKTFEKLEFEVMHFSDLEKNVLFKKIRKVALMDHSKNDCVVIIILTHGIRNAIFSHDDSFHISLITSYFTAENCPSLIGKPKLFLIQSCRGEYRDSGYQVHHTLQQNMTRHNWGAYEYVDTKTFREFRPLYYEEEFVHNPPNHPDFLIVRATMPEYVSFRNERTGSWFMQDLCAVLNTHGNEIDMLTLLTFVNNLVSLRESNPGREKQILCISSMLTKRLIFHAKKSQPCEIDQH